MTAAGRKEMFEKRQHFPPCIEIPPPLSLKKSKPQGWRDKRGESKWRGTRIFRSDMYLKYKQSLGVVHTTSRNGTICTPIFFIPGRVRFWNGNLAVNENDPRGFTPALTLIIKRKEL